MQRCGERKGLLLIFLYQGRNGLFSVLVLLLQVYINYLLNQYLRIAPVLKDRFVNLLEKLVECVTAT